MIIPRTNLQIFQVSSCFVGRVLYWGTWKVTQGGIVFLHLSPPLGKKRINFSIRMLKYVKGAWGKITRNLVHSVICWLEGYGRRLCHTTQMQLLLKRQIFFVSLFFIRQFRYIVNFKKCYFNELSLNFQEIVFSYFSQWGTSSSSFRCGIWYVK